MLDANEATVAEIHAIAIRKLDRNGSSAKSGEGDAFGEASGL